MKRKNIVILILCSLIILLAIFYKMEFCSPTVYKGETDNWLVCYEVYDSRRHSPYILASIKYKAFEFDKTVSTVDFEIDCILPYSPHNTNHYTVSRNKPKYKFKFDINSADMYHIEEGYINISWEEKTDKIILGKIK